MRIAPILVILIAALSASCERESDSGPPPTIPSPATTSPTTTRRALPTTDEIFGTPSSTTNPTATARAGSAGASGDPLATPDAAVAQLFELMQKKDVTGVRAMMADPPPSDQLRRDVSAVAERMSAGAKWEIVQSRVEGVAAIVIYRTTFPDGKAEITPLMLVNRYDRWKVFLSQLNPRRLTPGEKESMSKVSRWAADRLDELRGVATTKAATAPAPPTAPTVKPEAVKR